jgi:hypothetical protein
MLHSSSGSKNKPNKLKLHTCFKLISCYTHFFTLKMEAKCSYFTSVDVHETTRRCIPEGRTLNNDRSENLKSCKIWPLSFFDFDDKMEGGGG